jgi:hypothetical protein
VTATSRYRTGMRFIQRCGSSIARITDPIDADGYRASPG